MMMSNGYTEQEYLPLSGVQHFVYCRRQWGLIHVEQQWVENFYTASGRLFHQNTHEGKVREKRRAKLISRALPVCSKSLGLYGVCDVVEFNKDVSGMTLPGERGYWQAYPVEYKRGKPKEGREDVAQLTAQAIALEEMLDYPVRQAAIYYGSTKRRLEVKITDAFIDYVYGICDEMHRYFKRGHTPTARRSKKCRACSFTNVCVREDTSETDVSSYFLRALE